MKSWVDESHVPLLLMRYEDMLARPLETFASAVRFAGLGHDEDRIERALEASRFERLKQREQESGFRETHRKSTHFFREGRAGSWREALSPAQVERLIGAHGEVMHRFGYLTEWGEPACGDPERGEEERREA